MATSNPTPAVEFDAELLTRYDVVSLFSGDEIHRAHVVFWLFALGWAAVKASRNLHRVLVSVLVVATVPGFFDDPAREEQRCRDSARDAFDTVDVRGHPSARSLPALAPLPLRPVLNIRHRGFLPLPPACQTARVRGFRRAPRALRTPHQRTQLT